MIKAVLFDFYGTLAYDTINFNETWYAYYTFLYNQFNKPKDYQSYLTAMHKTIDWAKYLREVKHREVTFYQFHTRVLKLLDISISNNILDTLYEIYLKHKKVIFYDDVEKILEEVKKQNYKVGLISNANSILPAMKLKDAGLDVYFNKICISSEIGIRKPHPRIFECVLHALQVSPNDAVMVGDHFKLDIFGAKRIGMKAILIHRTEKSKIHDERYSPDFIINSISELPSVLKALNTF